MYLNCDLGESFGSWRMSNDEDIMPFIHQANVACGFHAGDPIVMQQAISLAKRHKVQVGAHVSYPDLQGFGRRSMNLAANELVAIIQAQIAILEGLAKCQGLSLSHVKPHGALYNDMMLNQNIFESVLQAMHGYHHVYPLMIQALADNKEYISKAKALSVPLLFEAFADRAYTDEGFLQARHLPNAVLNHQQALAQVALLLNENKIRSVNGIMLNIKADTICVHSDTKDAIVLSKNIAGLLSNIIKC